MRVRGVKGRRGVIWSQGWVWVLRVVYAFHFDSSFLVVLIAGLCAFLLLFIDRGDVPIREC